GWLAARPKPATTWPSSNPRSVTLRAPRPVSGAPWPSIRRTSGHAGRCGPLNWPRPILTAWLNWKFLTRTARSGCLTLRTAMGKINLRTRPQRQLPAQLLAIEVGPRPELQARRLQAEMGGSVTAAEEALHCHIGLQCYR